MPTAVVIANIQTEDKAPAVAPFVISPDPGHSTVTFDVTATHDGQIVPSNDLIPLDGVLSPDDGFSPDDGYGPDYGVIIPGGPPRDIIGIIVRDGGTNPGSGKLVSQQTNRCGPYRICGTPPDRAVSAHGMRVASGVTQHLSETFTQHNDGGADGPRTVNVWVHTENQGWS